MSFGNPLLYVSGGTLGSTVNGPTREHPLVEVYFLTPFLCTQEENQILLHLSLSPLFLVLLFFLFLSFSSESLANTGGWGGPQGELLPQGEKEGGQQRGQQPKEDAWLQSVPWDMTLTTLLLVLSPPPPISVLSEACTEHWPSPTADALPASWSKALQRGC